MGRLISFDIMILEVEGFWYQKMRLWEGVGCCQHPQFLFLGSDLIIFQQMIQHYRQFQVEIDFMDPSISIQFLCPGAAWNRAPQPEIRDVRSIQGPGVDGWHRYRYFQPRIFWNMEAEGYPLRTGTTIYETSLPETKMSVAHGQFLEDEWLISNRIGSSR